jgi:GNAT superfamily N-acetyltransferase
MPSDELSIQHRLDPEAFRALADALGDTPETVISTHLLRRGMCKAYVAGTPSQFDGAIVQAHNLPAEPTGFGSDPHVLWKLLQSVEGWDCVVVESECASALGERIQVELGVGVHYLDDVHYTLGKRGTAYHDSAVRLLKLKDLELLASADPDFRSGGWESPRELLSEGIIACAIVAGEIVSTALTTARSKRYADVGVYTHEDYRRRGLATAAASIVVNRVQRAGQTPVWSTGEHNAASLRVAQKLGFIEVSRRTYVILEKNRDAQSA